jgi:hypothetical protein
VALNEKHGFENIRKGNKVRYSHAVATKIEDIEASFGGTISGFGRH